MRLLFLERDIDKALRRMALEEEKRRTVRYRFCRLPSRGVLRPAFQMAVDDDILVKNPFGFQLAGVLVNDEVTREAITKDQMRKFLKFVHDDVVYCKYYEVAYILFHTGMRISEFCGLTLKDIDLQNKTVNIDHQLQRTSDMRYIIESTKTDAGTRVLPITEDVAQMFQAIIEDRNAPKVEKSIDGYSGFLFYDDNGMPLVAMHWQHRFNHMVGRYNDIYRVQMPNITPYVCRHTYCSNMAKSGMNPKTLQYLMGHSDISVTMNVYTHIGFDDAEEELKRMDISFNENGMCLKPIRNPVDGGSTFSLTCTFSMGLLAKIYEYLGDGEMERREFKAFFVDFQNKRDIASHNLDMII